MEISTMIMLILTEVAQRFTHAPSIKSPLTPLLSKRGRLNLVPISTTKVTMIKCPESLQPLVQISGQECPDLLSSPRMVVGDP